MSLELVANARQLFAQCPMRLGDGTGLGRPVGLGLGLTGGQEVVCTFCSLLLKWRGH